MGYDKEQLDELLLEYIDDPTKADINFKLGVFYQSIGQTASAVSFYIRTAERCTDSLLKYESLVRAGMCFLSQGCRNRTVEGMLVHAIAILPKRPEAYFHISKLYEAEKKWSEAYLMASIGSSLYDKDSLISLQTDVDFPGYYGLLFQKAVSGYWVGLGQESRDLFRQLIHNYKMNDTFYYTVAWNLNFYGEFKTEFKPYNKSELENLKLNFDGIEKIEENFSEAFQDLFVLHALKGKRKGSFLEIGAGDPFLKNNTALLEKQFNWKGILIDVDEEKIISLKKERKSSVVKKDARTIDYIKLLSKHKMPKVIDYLQLDCDPTEFTYETLLQIPFDTYKFRVITYEHDYYLDKSKSFRRKSREFLESKGYKLVLGNVAPDEWKAYEDWWVHPDLVDMDNLEDIISTDCRILEIRKHLLT